MGGQASMCRAGLSPMEAACGLLVLVSRTVAGFDVCKPADSLVRVRCCHMVPGLPSALLSLAAAAQQARSSCLLALRPYRTAALSNHESLKERKLGALHQALAMYRSRLGLEFVHGAGAAGPHMRADVDATMRTQQEQLQCGHCCSVRSQAASRKRDGSTQAASRTQQSEPLHLPLLLQAMATASSCAASSRR